MSVQEEAQPRIDYAGTTFPDTLEICLEAMSPSRTLDPMATANIESESETQAKDTSIFVCLVPQCPYMTSSLDSLKGHYGFFGPPWL